MNTQEIILKGTPICRGVAIGRPFFVTTIAETPAESRLNNDHIDAEISRYHIARARSKAEITDLQRRLELAQMQEGIAILESQQLLIEDSLFTKEIENGIRENQSNTESVLQNIMGQYQQKFQSLSDPYFRERFKDVQDIAKRILRHLGNSIKNSWTELPPDTIIFAHELTTSDAVEAHVARAGGFVTQFEGVTSHAAIVARARGTPYVSNIDISRIDNQHALVIVDGRTGEIILSPSPQTLARYQNIRAQLQSHLNKLNHVSFLATETYDGYGIRLSANIEMSNELEMLHQHGGHGVGLFRSEYIFLEKDKFPSEAEQNEIYRDLVLKMHGLPIVIRTFDVGGDKQIPSHLRVVEENPFLGCRAIRFLLKEREIFKTQLRAILRASTYGDVSIMFPMVSTLSELLEAKAIVKECQSELSLRGEHYGKVRIGCMIEVPSAAIIADLLAKECDYLSIGTNDLVQYALAVDRGNHAMRALYTPTHPSMIRLIKHIVHQANQHNVPVTMCGEVAADPRFVPLLLGLGVHELSVATRYIPAVKNAIRNTSIITANRLAEKVLALSTAAEIQELLAKEYQANVPEDCFYNC